MRTGVDKKTMDVMMAAANQSANVSMPIYQCKYTNVLIYMSQSDINLLLKVYQSANVDHQSVNVVTPIC